MKGYDSSQSPRLELRHNGRDQVIGTNSDKFSTHLECLVHEHVPVVIKNWTKINSRTRDDLWTLVQVYKKIYIICYITNDLLLVFQI